MPTREDEPACRYIGIEVDAVRPVASGIIECEHAHFLLAAWRELSGRGRIGCLHRVTPPAQARPDILQNRRRGGGAAIEQANCQVDVSLSVANRAANLSAAYRLYLPERWASDEKRRKKAGVPYNIEIQTKPKIAFQQIEWACAAGIVRGVVLMDCAYGSDLSLRRRLTALDLVFAVEVWARTPVRKAKRGDDAPVTAAELAKGPS